MDFEIPEELKMVRSLAKDFVNDQLKPLERDILGRAADLSDARMSLTPDTEERLINMAKEVGLWGIGVPEEFGGAGLGTLGDCLVEEELARTIIPFNPGNVSPLLFECNAGQQEKYLQPVLNREKNACIAIIEPDKGADLSDFETKAVKEDDHYIINGHKITFTKPGDEYFAIVFASTDDSETKKGTTCFLVDKDTPGLTISGSEELTGWRSQVRKPFQLLFENCPVPAENILGKEGKAFHLGSKWLPLRRILRGARCIGVAERLLEEATTQATSWQSMGQFISRRTDIQAALADMAVTINAARLMVYNAAWKADEDKAVKNDAAMVKLFTTDMLYKVADGVAHVFNGPAYVAGLPVERLCRNALAASTTEMALTLQRNVIAEDIFKGLKV